MKSIQTKTTALWLLAAIIALSSCSHDPIYETAHPDHGTITLTTDWSATDAAASPPAYTVAVDNYSAVLTGTVNTIDNLFLPGAYHAHIYNEAAQVSVSGHTATVAGATAPAGRSGTFVDNMPGWFYSSALDVTITQDVDHTYTARMRQQVVEMTFTVTPSGNTTDLVESITGTLGGIAGTMNMDDNVRSAMSSVALAFAKQANGKWKATIRLLGIVGDEQPLLTVVKFTDGTFDDLESTTDIHDAIKDHFDSGGGPTGGGTGGSTTPNIDLGTEIIETPTDVGFTATITEWTNDSGTIDVQ